MVLVGTEVKALREGKANLRDAYAVVRGNAVWLVNCHISQYLPGGPYNHEPLRPRKLLMNLSEIFKLGSKTQQKGLTLVPLRIDNRHDTTRCELALAGERNKHDRRQPER